MATTTIEPFVGKWTLKSSENFDDYMKVLGVNVALRKMGNLAKPDLLISVDGNGVVTMKSVSTLKTMELMFKLDEEFDESTADGRQTKSLITVRDGKLVQRQTWNGKETTIERELQDGMLITKCTMGDVVSTRIYEKAA